MSGLLSLGQYILVPIFSEWIGDSDLGCLDSAVCHHEYRERFLQDLRQCSILNTAPEREYHRELFDWLLMRGIGLKTAIIKSEYAQDVSAKLQSLLSTTKHLSRLTIESKTDPTFVNGLGLTVDLLSVERVEDFQKIAELDLVFFSLDLSNYDALTDDDFASIVPRCSNLKLLSVPGHIDVSSLLRGFGVEKFRCGLKNIISDNESITICELQRVSSADAATICIGDNIYCVTSLEIDETLGEDGLNFLTNHLDHLRSVRLMPSSSDAIDFTGFLSCVIAKCFHLRTFASTDVNFADDDLNRILEHSPMLKAIEIIDGDGFSNAVSQIVKCCKNVDSLTFNERGVSDDAMIELFSGCPRLTELECGTGGLDETALLHVARNLDNITLRSDLRRFSDYMETVSGFTWSCVKRLTNEGLNAVFSQNPTLKRLSVIKITEFDDDTCAQLVEHCPLLTSFAVSKCKLVSENSLTLLGKCKYLTSLSMDGLEITCNQLEDLLKDKPGFTKLALPDCRLLGATEECFKTIAKYCPMLRHLDLTYNKEITTSDVLVLLAHCPLLNYMKLLGCGNVSMGIFDVLKSRQMRYLNVKRCDIATSSQEFLSMNYSCSCEFVY